MRALGLLLVVCVAGCIEGEEEGVCFMDDQCESAQVCSTRGYCVAADTVRTVAISWTFDGVAPTPAAPAPCDALYHFAVGISDPTGGNLVESECSAGVVNSDRVPKDATEISVIGYGPEFSILDREDRTLAPDVDVTLVVDLQLPP